MTFHRDLSRVGPLNSSKNSLFSVGAWIEGRTPSGASASNSRTAMRIGRIIRRARRSAVGARISIDSADGGSRFGRASQYRVPMLRKVLLGIVLLIVLVAAAIVLVARGVVGNATLRTTLEQQLSARLKQPVRIARLGASFYPRVAIDLHDITIGEPAGATIAELSVTTGLRGLLSRRVEDAEVIVSNSRIPVPVAVGIAGAVTSGPPSTSGG